jgi:natural product precursor
MEKLKLPKFEMEQLSLEEMDAIRAGSGTSTCGSFSTTSDTGEFDDANGDSDDD